VRATDVTNNRRKWADGQFLAIGECMIEIARSDGRSCRVGYAGDTFNTAWYARALLGAFASQHEETQRLVVLGVVRIRRHRKALPAIFGEEVAPVSSSTDEREIQLS